MCLGLIDLSDLALLSLSAPCGGGGDGGCARVACACAQRCARALSRALQRGAYGQPQCTPIRHPLYVSSLRSFLCTRRLLYRTVPRLTLLLVVYTTARTVGARRILELPTHLERLCGVSALLQRAPLSATQVSALVLPSLTRALHAFRAASAPAPVPAATTPESSAQEARVMMCVGELGHGGVPYDVLVLAEPLPPPPAWPVSLECRRGIARVTPELKSSEWALRRKNFQAERLPDSEDVVLLGDDGRCYEGLSSNFIVLARTPDAAPVTLCTAPAGTVLEGTMLRVVLDAATDLGYAVQREAPLLPSSADSWLGAGVCSTSRLLLPASTLHVRSAAGALEYTLRWDSVAPEMRALVSAVHTHLAAHATPLPDPGNTETNAQTDPDASCL